MIKQTRRDFLKAATIAGIGTSQILAEGKTRPEKALSKIKVAQIRVYPDKGALKTNHAKLMEILGEIEKDCEVDVLVTPEGFLDGYVVTEKSVTREDLVGYAINPEDSEYTLAISDWARRTNRRSIQYGVNIQPRRRAGGNVR